MKSYPIGTPSIAQANPVSELYTKGSDNVDGSIRAIPDIGVEEDEEFQLRKEGVWNDTGIQIAAATMKLGRELLVSAGGEFIRTGSISDPNFEALIPHIQFTDDGTSQSAHLPILSAKIIKRPFQPDDSSVRTGTNISYFGPAPSTEFVTAIYYRTGPTAATQPVTLTVRITSFDGLIIFRQAFPASTFPANTEIKLDAIQAVSVILEQNLFVSLTSDAVFSLKVESTFNIVPWLSTDLFLVTEEDLISSTTGMDRVLIDQLGHIVADQSGNLVLNGASP